MAIVHEGKVSVADLRGISLFSTLSDEYLSWLAVATDEARLPAGEWLSKEGDPATCFYVVFEGELESLREVGSEQVRVIIHSPGGFLGGLPLLTGVPTAVSTRAIDDARIGMIGTDTIRKVLYENIEVERQVLGTFAPVGGRFESVVAEQAKLAALGTMSAGLAHELGNPAAAAARSADLLAQGLYAIQGTMKAFVESGVEREDAARFVALQQRVLANAAARAADEDAPELDSIAQADLEDALCTWLEAHGVDEAWNLAPELVASGVNVACLEEAADAAGSALDPGLRSMVAVLTANSLVDELRDATGRMSRLVKAIKEYTYMDRASRQDVNVHHDLVTTLTILGHKLKRGSIRLDKHFAPDLPVIQAPGAELNQVWTNLIDNAIDAIDGDGTLTITTSFDRDYVYVAIGDDGPGIPEELKGRIFDPFFTTKPVGQGTGLGLDTTRRILREMHARIDLDTGPSGTTFTVALPREETRSPAP